MTYLDAMRAGFLDELEKIAGWSRKGSVPIRAENAVDKHNKGTLKLRSLKKFKDAGPMKKEGSVVRESRGHYEGIMEDTDGPLSGVFAELLQQHMRQHSKNAGVVAYADGEDPTHPRPMSVYRKKKGDAPSKEDADPIPKREDGRDNAATVTSMGQSMTNVGASLGSTGEHS